MTSLYPQHSLILFSLDCRDRHDLGGHSLPIIQETVAIGPSRQKSVT